MPTDARRPLLTRLGGRARRSAKRAAHEVLAKGATARLRRRSRSLPALSVEPGPLQQQIRMVISTRVASDDRLRLLQITARRLALDLADDPPALTVRDASDEPYLAASRRIWAETGLPVEHVAAHEMQLASFRHLAHTAVEPYLLLQFDDILTAGMSPAYLGAACAVLERWHGVVDVVCPIWSLRTELDHEARTVSVVSDRRSAAWYQFRASRPRRPIAIEVVEGLRFGIFENPTYGFFFNNLLVPRADYARRVEWYASHVSDTSVHQVEVAAEHGLTGPAWRHVAICLDGVSLVDIDYAHTEVALRQENPELRAVADRLEQGWSFQVAPAPFGRGTTG